MKFRAHLQQMADGEIKAMIPPYFIEDVKRRDPKPLFKAFIIGQEGEAEGNWVGVGKVVKTWFADAIGKLSRKIWAGMKLFSGHGETNDQEGRTQIGEVAGSRTRTIDGKFSAMIAAYIYPEYKNMPFDVASVEADININDVSGDVHAVDVDEVTGIALGNSAIDKPGFPGATLLGELQAFANGQSQFQQGGGNMPTSIEEIKKFVGEEGISPSDIFGRDSLIDDPVVKGYVDEREKMASSGEYAHRKRTDTKFDEKKKEWEDEKKEKNEEIKKLKTKNAQRDAVELFDKKIKERKLDGKQGEFIKSKQEDFLPEDLEAVEKEVDKFMDKKLEEFNKTAKIFGHETEEKKDESKGGGEPGESGTDEGSDLIPD